MTGGSVSYRDVRICETPDCTRFAYDGDAYCAECRDQQSFVDRMAVRAAYRVRAFESFLARAEPPGWVYLLAVVAAEWYLVWEIVKAATGTN